jgi:hypothetical protein
MMHANASTKEILLEHTGQGYATDTVPCVLKEGAPGKGLYVHWGHLTIDFKTW